MNGNEVVDITTILTWPQALVAVVLIVAVLIVPQIGAYVQARRSASAVDEVKKTLTTNNGGSHIKDAIDRMERRQEESLAMSGSLSDRLDEHIEEARTRDERIAALEAVQQRRGLFSRRA